ncbi:glucosamine-6-phosphate deaminase [Leucobacter komagatae]|uniref:Multidrug transporter n=1 Tax=Leucobacter komagatae TaxID=55969 RepID=A0A0D0HVV9_9MICO|nr:glucosamine-6-phosphate deaminase [Leucobacter komagatae]KIP51766.1 multidrug transporter [Leucobacter komagatae]
MEVRVFDEPADLGCFAAEQVIAAITEKPDAVIGLATGSSPLPLYRAWADIARERGLDLSQVRGFALDEYAGIDPAHPESYHTVVTQTVVEPVGLTPELVAVPDADASAESAAAYEAAIAAAGGIDVQILGIGRNGHLGFNEPGSPLDSRTRKVQLTAETITDNARFFDSEADVPTEAITQGLGTIMDARKLVIVAVGEAKAAAVAAAIHGPVTERVPASIAQRHANVVYVLDAAAASQLPARSVTAEV